MTTKTITVRDFLAQVRRDGLRKAIGAEFKLAFGDDPANEWGALFVDNVVAYLERREDSKIGSACAMGQGFINSGVREPVRDEDFNTSPTYSHVYGVVSSLNDSRQQNLTIEEVADSATTILVDTHGEAFLDEVMEFEVFDYTPYLHKSYNPK